MMAAEMSDSGGSSDSSSTAEEERVRRLFQTCDGDGDGFINRNDLLMVCRQLNMEASVAEIMGQLGADERGRISLEDFTRCRTRLQTEIQKEEAAADVFSGQKVVLVSPRVSSWPNSSENSTGAQEQWDFDSGPGDSLSAELLLMPPVLTHTPVTDTASLDGDVLELNQRLMQSEREKEVLGKRLTTAQCDRCHLLRGQEELQERSRRRYEERITELHSIIAELNKKIQLLQGATIREEDEVSERRWDLGQGVVEVMEEQLVLDQENQPLTADTGGGDLNWELQRVLMGLERVVCARRRSGVSVAEVDRHMEQLSTTSQHCDLAIRTVEEIEGALGREPYPTACEERVRWEREASCLRQENQSLSVMLCRREEELQRSRAAVCCVREERDRLRRRVRELQARLQNLLPSAPPSPARLRPINPSTGELSTSSSSNDLPVPRLAERVKLYKTRSDSLSADRSGLGSEISSLGVSSPVAEHLAQSLQDCCNVQEIFHTLHSHGSSVSDSKIREFQVETDRLNSRLEHLKSQNDLLTITLEECKSNAERMSMLVGKYESNATALRLALQYSEQCIEAHELLLALAESEQGLVLGQFRAAGVTTAREQTGDGGVSLMLKKAHEGRKAAENAARDLLARLDRSCGAAFTVTSTQPWESLSSTSHTSTSSTASSSDTEFSREDEQRLKVYVQQLKNDRAAVKLTMLELESVSVPPSSPDANTHTHTHSHRLDLENAVLMQELMAMKEEMSELKALVFLLEKDKASVELQLCSRETQEQVHLVQIEHLKSELEEHQEQRRPETGRADSLELGVCDGDASTDLSSVVRRERKLKARVQELLVALERLTKSSEVRHQQSAEFLSDLKRANSNLVAAYEKVKKKHQNKLKKLEGQMMAMVERHETQVRMLKQRVALLEEEESHTPHPNETSL